MATPSKNFTTIPDGDIDPESPITTSIMTALRDNDIHNKEWIGYGYTPAQAHDHDGVNSKMLPGNIFGNVFAYYHYK